MVASKTEGRRAVLFAELSLLLTAFFFGTNFVAVKYAVGPVPPLLFAAVRFTVAGLLLWLVLRLFEPQSRLSRAEMLPMFGLGIVGITVTQSVFTVGVSLTTAANTALVYSTSPIWGLLLGSLIGLERPRLRGVVGVALALTGVGFIVYGGLGLGEANLVGDFLILGAAVCWGSYTMLSLSFLERVSPLAVATYPMLLGGLAIFPFALFDLRVDTGSLSGAVWFAVLYSTVCSSAFGFAAWQKGVSRVGANRVLVYQYLVTLTGVSAGVVILGESFGYEKVLGAVILLVGVYLARRG
ncbi:MAG: Permease of the drug/metabolite transporter (DMT) superfamily [uncultured Rubrobacteraceae bacterium]|uniref:Permease of the drug/metabolite transporter (DMT) superfamily n=1 Tax=uncultured Rubrobacteraceae bacterium TaxID=349277 RepID=A0A6J4R346_9ACTN|nr:MAG: Permease of the drug/metabolite transporter (DMT) superfamily [uncultured Rubrobacteraceae bacterium]